VDAIIYVLRCFEDGDVTHVEGSVDPMRDADIIETELVLADMESLEKRLPNLQKKAKGGDKDSIAQVAMIERALKIVSEGKPARLVEANSADERKILRDLQLLTTKPVMYVANV